MPDVDNDGGNSKHDDGVPTLNDEEDTDDELNQHTLRLASTIVVGSEIMSLAFSDDGRFLLACCGDGMVRVFNPSNCSLISVLTSNRDDTMECSAAEVAQSRRSRRASSILDCLKLPCTCAAFRPHVREKTSGVAVIGFSRGEFQLWHVPSAKLLHRQSATNRAPRPVSYEIEEKLDDTRSRLPWKIDDNSLDPLDTEVLCCAYASTGHVFALGMSDGVAKVYSDNTKEIVAELKSGLGKDPGHSSRIFSLKFHPDDPNTLVTGGWDNCVFVWDIDKATAIQTLYGPHICGNAVDVVGKTILTGSWRDDDQLETWNMETGKRTSHSFWGGQGGALQGAGRRCRLFAVAFGGTRKSTGKFIAAGGGNGSNEVKIFASGDHRLIGSLLGLTAGAISLAFDESGSRLAVGLADGQVHFVEIEVTTSSLIESSNKGGKTIMVF